MQTDKDLQKCFTMLDNLKPGEILELSKIPDDRRSIFISCCKQYIDCYNTGEFNENYTKFKKIEKWNK